MEPVFVVSTVIILGLIILFHEFGHFITAKLSGMPVREFSVGFGRPILFQFTRGDTRYALRPFPLGGFVSIAGMEPGDDHPNGFDRHPLHRRIVVIAAGSLMNLLLAALIFVLIGLLFGKTIGISNRIAAVLPGRPAAKVGLQEGDQILAANGTFGPRPTLQKLIAARPGKQVELVVRRQGKLLHYRVVPEPRIEKSFEGNPPRYRERTIGMIGIAFSPLTRPMGVWESVSTGFINTAAVTLGMVEMLKYTVLGQLPVEVGGPVRIVYEIGEASRIGWESFLRIGAFLSVNVGFINLLPFPALDGSRIAILLVELVRRRPLDKRKEAIVHMVGLAILLALVALVTVHDINSVFFKGGQ